MKTIHLDKLVILALLAGCSSFASARQANEFPDFNINDTSQSLSLFTDNILSGPYNFLNVNDFTSNFVFSCQERTYEVQFRSRQNKTEIKSSLIGLKSSTKELKEKKRELINKQLAQLEVIGPVALRCSSNLEKKNPLHLTIRGGYRVKDQFHYSFKNYTFLLLEEDFTAK